MKKIMILAMSALLFVCCGGNGSGEQKEEQPTIDITGQWELTDISTKSARIGNETVTVYVEFNNGNFELYQVLGAGRPHKYTGTYTLSDNLLSGKYSEGKNWAASYEVSQSGSSLTLTKKGGGETDTYRKSSIPQDIKDNAI